MWDVRALILTALHFPSETTCSCKQDTKERYWGQMANGKGHFSLSDRNDQTSHCWPPSKLRSRIFRSDQTEMVRSIWWTNRNFQNFGLNGKRPWCTNLQLLESTLIQSQWKLLHMLWIWNHVDAKIYTNIFLSSDETRSSPVLYCEYCIQDGNLVPRFSLFNPSRPG